MVNTVKSAANLGRQALDWVGTQINNVRNLATQQWNNYQSRTSYHAAPAGGYGGIYGSGSSYAYTQQQQAQQRAQAEQRRQQAIRDEYSQATGIKGTPKSREAQNLFRNWGSALANTLKHVCEPKTSKANGGDGKTSIANFKKIEEAMKHGLSVEEKESIDQMSLGELKSQYGTVIGNYTAYLGTGYFNPMGSPKNRYIISKYNELKAIEDSKIAQQLAERNKYHYLNLYKTIAETGLRPDGTPASDAEKAIAPYVVSAGNVFEAGKSFAVVYSAYVSYQNYYGKPIYGVDTDWRGETFKPKLTADDIVFSDKFSKSGYTDQVTKRGWTNQKIADTINNPVKTSSSVNKYTGNTVTNYYINDTHYVAVDDVTGKVIQITKLNKTNWKGP